MHIHMHIHAAGVTDLIVRSLALAAAAGGGRTGGARATLQSAFNHTRTARPVHVHSEHERTRGARAATANGRTH